MATAANNPSLILNISGTQSVVLKRGEKTNLIAKAGQRYRVVKEGAEAAAKDVAAIQQGQDLLLSYADGTQVVLVSFYEACKAEQCAVDMPGAKGTGTSGGYVITGDSAVGASLSDGGKLVYAFGDTPSMAGLTQGAEQAQGFTHQDSVSTYMPPSAGAAFWTPLKLAVGAVGAAALLHHDDQAAPVPTIIHGSVVAGPVVAGNGLEVVAYKADGTVLASGAVNADGTFTLNVGNDYLGAVLVKVSDTNANPDYFDEATGAPKDLTTDLRALTVIPAAGTYNVSVNVLTELAVRNLGLTGGDTGTSSTTFANVSQSQITQANQKVAATVGLTQDLVLGTAPVAIVTTDGSSNTQTNDYGRLLASLSGAEVGSTTTAVIDDLAAKLQSTQAQATGQVLETLLEGAAKVNLVAAISDITNQKSTAITIDAVAQDNRLSPTEMIAGVQVQGTAAAGASVALAWSDSTGTATATGTRTVTADSQGRWSTSFTSAEMPALGATTLKATVGSNAATRSIYLDEPLAPTITLTQMTGSGNLTGNGHVDVSGILSGAGWDYSLDGGTTWTPGSGSGFTATGDGAKQVLVRQNIGGHTSPSSNTLNFDLDATAPSLLGLALATDTGSSATDGTSYTSTVNVTGIEAGATWQYSIDGGSNWADGTAPITGTTSSFTLAAGNHAAGSVQVRQTDAAGNASLVASTTSAITIDTTGPSRLGLALGSDTGSSSTDSISTTGTVNVTGIEVGATWQYSLDGGGNWTDGTVPSSGTTSSFTLAAGTHAAGSVQVRQTDVAGNTSALASNTAAITIDTAAPAVTLSSATDDVGSVTGPVASGSSTDDTALVLSGTNEAGATVAVYNGTTLLGAATVTGTNWTYSATVANGSTYQFNATATDAAGNTSAATTNHTVIGDTTSPAVTLSAATDDVGTVTGTVASGSTTDDTALVLSGTNEAGATVAVYNGTNLLGAATVNGTSWTYSATVANGSTYQFNATATDAAGNTSAATANHTVIGDTAEPTVTITSSATSLGPNATATLTFTLSEAIADFGINSITVTGGTLSNFSGSGTSYTATFTPDAGLSGAATVNMAASVLTDAAGNSNSAASNTVSITVDTQAPTVASITASRSSLLVDQTASLNITLSEASTTFGLADLQAIGGTLSNLTGSGTSYTATFTPDDNRTDAGSVSVKPRSFSDEAGNISHSSDNDGVVMSIQTMRPTAQLTARQLKLGIGDVTTIDITLSEDSTDFTMADLTASNGTLSEFTPLGDGLHYSVVFTPTAPYTGGGRVTLADGSFTNLAGNSNRGGAQPASTGELVIDTTPPTVTITSDVTALAIGQSATVTFTFNKDPGDSFDATDITVNGGTLSNLVNNTGTIWTALFTPTDGSTGQASITVAAGAFTDAAGNKGTEGATPGITIDTQGPVADSLLPGNASTVLPGHALVLNFNEVVHKGTGNLVLVNDTASTRTTLAMTDSAVVLSGDGKTLTITPATSLVAGNEYHVEADPASLLDAAGNAWAGIAASSSWSGSGWHFTAATPSVSLNKISTDNRINGAENTAGVTVSGVLDSETLAVVQAFQAGDFTVTLTQGGTSIPVTVNSYVVTNGVGAWSGTTAAGAFTQNGTYSVDVTASRVINSSTVSASTIGSVLVDLSAAAPTLSLLNDTGSSNSDGKTSDATVSVSGLEAKASWEYSTDSGTTWQAGSGTQFTGAGTDGARSVQVRQTDAASNVSSNGTLSFTLDTSAAKPVINAVAVDNIINASEVGGAITGTAEAGASVQLQLGIGTQERNVTVMADGSGNWSYTPNAGDLVALGMGATQITANQTDLAGNTSNIMQRNLRVDTVVPTVSIDTTLARLDAATPSTQISFTLSEKSADFTASSVTVTGGTLSNFEGSLRNYTATFTPTNAATTAGNISVAAGAFHDAAGNANVNPSNTIALSIDKVRPTVAIASDLATLAAGEVATLTFTLSEASDDFGVDKINVVGGNLGQLSANAAHTVFTGLFTPTDGFAGAGSVSVANSTFHDRGYNANADGSDTNNTVALTIQTTPITLNISSDKTALKGGETATLDFTFSSAPTGFTAGDITVAGGTLSALTTVDSTHFTATFTPTANAASGTASVSVANGSYTGASGNLGQGAKVAEISLDTLAPTLKTLNPDDNGYLAAGNALVATFTESVFAGSGNIRLVDDTASTTVTYAITDSAIAINGDTLTVTPSTALVAGHNYHLSIDNTALVDAAGNDYAGIANATSWNFGATNLSTTLNLVTGDSRINSDESVSPIVLSGTVSSLNPDVLAALQASDIEVKVTVPHAGFWLGGNKVLTCTDVTYNNSTGEWSATLPGTWEYYFLLAGTTTNTLIDGDTDTIAVTISGRNGTAAAGLSTTLSDTMTVDLSSPATPTLSLASDTGSSNVDGITRNGLINVSSLEAGGSWQYSLDNGSNWQPGAGSSLALSQDGAYTVQVKQFDAAGNASAAQSLAVTRDTQANAPVTNPIATDNRINASEVSSAITGTAEANASVSLEIGANTRSVTANSSGVWSYSLIAADITAMGQGNEVIRITQTDKAGNTGSHTSAVIEVDTVRPTVTLANIGSTSLLAGQSTTISATLSELPTNFSESNFTVSGGTLSNLKIDSTGLVYTGTFTPDANSTTAGSIQLAAGNVHDAADNTNAAASNALALTVNTVVPTAAVTSSVAAGTTLHAGDTATLTFTLSAASSDFTAADVTVVGGALSNFAGTGTSYTATYTPDANSKAPGSVSVASGVFVNAAGNANADGLDANNSVAFSIATVRPTVTISSDVGTLGGGQTAVITFNFSEDPGSSFVLSDISTTNGSVSALAGTGHIYTALFTPTAGFGGAASILVANGNYTNSEGSLGQAGESPAITIDAVTPTVAISRSASGTLGAGQTDTVTFDFSEAPGSSFTRADVDVSGGTLGTLSAVSATQYVATFTPTVSAVGTAKISIASNRFTDAAGNLNADGSDANNALDIAFATAAITTGSVAATDVPTLSLAADTGANTTDHITNNSVINVTNLVDGATWEYSIDGGTTWASGSGTSFTLPSAGTYSALQVRQSDGITTSNVGTLAGTAVNYLTAYAGTLALVLRNDTGSSATDALTYDGVVNILGLGTQDTWRYSFDSGRTWTNGIGSTIPTQTESRAQKIFVEVTDLAGNQGTVKRTYTLDLTIPAAPDVTLTADPSDGGALVAATNIEGKAIVDYRLDNGSGYGAWTGTYTAPTTAGNYTLQVRQTDLAGNVSNATTLTFTVATGAAVVSAIDLSAVVAGTGGFVITGQCADDQSGWSVSAAGDVNGDGLADLIVGANYSDPGTVNKAGRSYVVFGKTSGGVINLSALAGGNGGFVINGQCAEDQSGVSVSAAGDVNGDGLADLIVGAYNSDPSARGNAGRSYVVFGKATGTEIDLSAVAAGNGGFVINGQCAADFSGRSVSAAGDVNGDGLADLIVGANQNDTYAGRSYVVFGKAQGTGIDLSAVALGSGGFAIKGPAEWSQSGYSVSAAGDVNGDGLADLIVGAPYEDLGSISDAGRSYVVFGKTSGSTINLAALDSGVGGFAISGQCYYQNIGWSVSAAGDVNGDGLADVIVGAPYSYFNTTARAGRSFVVFGKTSGMTLNVSQVAAGNGGFVINGQCEYDNSGWSVSSAGDVNGDGLADLIVGSTNQGNTATVRSYLVFGQTDTTAINLSAVAKGTGGFVIKGQCADDQSGYSVSAAGDVNGDGLADLIVGAPFSDPVAGSNAGSSYVIFGNTTGVFAQTQVDWLGTDGADTQSDAGVVKTLVAGAGNDSLTATAASVLYGGAGNDTFTINAAMVTALQNPFGLGGNVSKLARIDGGGGLDKIALSGTGLTFDLTQVANQAASNPDGGSRIDSVETIDLTGSGNNTLLLKASDVVDMSGMNLFNSGNGWTGLAATVPRHQLLVQGDAGDVLRLGIEWNAKGLASFGGANYKVYNAGSGAQLLVSAAITVDLTPQVIHLSAVAAGIGGFVINGDGAIVSNAGDVNGDGLDDVIVGAMSSAGPGPMPYAGRSYVVFGNTVNAPVNLSAVALGSGGFVINGQARDDYSGGSVSSAGDVNGDGLADLIVGAGASDPVGRGNAGRTYVVFGKTGGTAVDLITVAAGNGGFVINGESSDDNSGDSVANAGDVNGDGFADLIIGAKFSSPSSRVGAGRSYVVFGKSTATEVDLRAVAGGLGGFVINGESSYDYSGGSVSSAGDVNGDGLDDLIVGAPGLVMNVLGLVRRSYVVFGKTAGVAVDLSAVAGGTGGFIINGQCANDMSGASVSSAGDVNGDGLADLIVGAPGLVTNVLGFGGLSYVVFGKSSGASIDLSAVAAGIGGFVINGQCANDLSGSSVSSAGDVNGDGLADLIVGARTSDPVAGSNAGRTYVVFGQTQGTAIDLSAVALGSGGFVINGQCANDLSGYSVSAAGDFNGDGLADLIIGAANAVRSYVIFGSTSGAFNQTAVDQMGTAGVDTLSDNGIVQTLVAGAGNDSLTATAASVLYGGSGNDTFTINQTMLTALQSPMGSGGNVDQLARIDGGTGTDTMTLSGSRMTLTLANLAQGRVQAVEAIDLTGSGNNLLDVSAGDVAALAGMNLINSGTTGWSSGTYTLSASVSWHQMLVEGNSGDLLRLGAGWTQAGTLSQMVNNSPLTYSVYANSATREQLIVNNAVKLVVQPTAIQLSTVAGGTGGFVINGQCANDLSGSSIVALGDLNGDGLTDFAIGAPSNDTNGTDAGRSYVVFGRTDNAAINLSAVASGSGGFAINAQAAGDHAGYSVSAVGDLNGDGLTDLLIGAPNFNNGGILQSNHGRSYVVFGKSTGAAVNLSAVAGGTSGGFAIIDALDDEFSGWSVASGGDVNGDGLNDLIIGADQSNANGTDSGRVYVVFGKSTSTAVNLSAVFGGAGGFAINGQSASDLAGSSVSVIGDVNGDGLADMLIGAPQNDVSGTDAGRSYVVFGKASGTAINLSAVANGSGGFAINGQAASDLSGSRVTGLGDINGDGIADFAIGAPKSDATGVDAGRVYVVFGKTTPTAINLSAVAGGSGGFVINGQSAGDEAGYSISKLGDLNADGLADYLVGAHFADPNGGNSGRAYVVFGRSDTQAIKLSAVAAGSGGFVINGQAASDEAGFIVSAAGDLNGDGFTDLLIGAPSNDANSVANAGRSYVIWGNNPNVLGSSSFDPLQSNGTVGADNLNDNGVSTSYVAGSGNDTLTASAASVLYAGMGNDTLNITGAMLTALENTMRSGGNMSRLARVDGGEGTDTLALSGAGDHLNLSQIQQIGDSPRIAGIEVIDLTGSGNNMLSPTAQGIIGMSGVNVFNSTNGWTGLTGTSTLHQVRVEGNAGDKINLPSGWTLAGNATWNSTIYAIYNSGTAQMLVNSAVTVQADVAPTVSSVALTATTGAQGGWLGTADTVTATVTFSEAVTVNTSGGTPTLALDVGGTTVQASYAGGSGGTTLTFTASVAAGLADADGIAIGANALALNGGAIADLTHMSAVVSHGVVTANANYRVDTVVATPNATASSGVLGAPSNAEAGATVEYRIATLTGSFGAWNSNLSAIQPATDGTADGRYRLEVRQTDVAGNVSAVQAVRLDVGNFYMPLELSDIASGMGGFVINGRSSDYSVSSAGDVNGDGLADLIVGFQYSVIDGAGRSYVVFGQSTATAIDLSDVSAGHGGFVINGQPHELSGKSVSSAGDVNGDGYADVIVGAPAGASGGLYSGSSYVVFGQSTTTAIYLSRVAAGNGGYVINGLTYEHSGESVSSAGDVNGDGLADLIVSSLSDTNIVRSYVVFGQSMGSAINLSAVEMGQGGFAINGQSSSDSTSFSGVNVSSAGDVNGDGFADLIVGVALRGFGSGSAVGGAGYVVFGKSTGAAIDLSALSAGLGGFAINGVSSVFDNISTSFSSVSSAGDVNGDGLADLIVGMSMDGSYAGRSYVLFGRSTGAPIDLSAVATGNGGFVINGEPQSLSGVSVSSAGDVNGDGLADLIVGASFFDVGIESSAGRSYVVFGKSTGTAIDLSSVAAGSGGFVIDGFLGNEFTGNVVSSAGDVNGDGLADLIVGNKNNDSQSSSAGRSYVIFGSTSGAFNQTAVDALGTSGDDTLSDSGVAKTLVGGAGNDTLTATGASVLMGGAGDDSLVIGQTMLTALQNPLGNGGNSTQLARIDAGSGVDRIILSGSGLQFDLTHIAGSAMTPESDARLESIELVDLTGSGNNTLLLTAKDVLDMSGAVDLVLTDLTHRRELLVKGNAGDVLDLKDGSGTTGWAQAMSNATAITRIYEGVTYEVWHASNNTATLLVQQGMSVI